MKTVLLTGNISTGLLNFRRELIERLVQDYRVVALAADRGNADEYRAIGCEFRSISFKLHGINPLSEMRLVSKYKKIIGEIKPDVVLTYTIKPNVYAGMACESLGIPCIANITGLGPAVENHGIMQKITLPLYRRGLRKARKVFFQNRDNMDFMVKNKIVSGPYDLIPGSGVSLDRFPLQDYPEGDTVEFTFIARIVKEKGIEQYLDAAIAIRPKHPETVFHVCGRAGRRPGA